MKDLNAGLKALTVEDERKEVLAVLNSNGELMPILKMEKPQKNYKLVNDVPTLIGYLDMYTIENDWYDKLGRNRKGSTFGLLGLQELGIDLAKCQIVTAAA